MIIDFINGLADSIRENTPILLGAVANLCTAFLDGILNFFGISGGTSEEGKGLASSILQGMIDGIQSMIGNVVNTVKNLASAALDEAKDILGIASPSKEFALVGRYCDEGMADGIARYSKVVTDETEALGGDSLKIMKSTMSKLSDALDTDLDANPVITPVLDLSDVESGASALSSLLNKGQAYGLAASISKSEQRNASDQNGSDSSNNTTTVVNKFDLSNLTIRQESDVDAIAEKLYHKQQTAMRGKGMRVAYST